MKSDPEARKSRISSKHRANLIEIFLKSFNLTLCGKPLKLVLNEIFSFPIIV